LTISDCEDILGDAHLGDSISVNGAFSVHLKLTPIDRP
jgi:riboflavin synthase alpha subunit